MSLLEYLTRRWEDILWLVNQHIQLVLLAVLLAAALGIGLGFATMGSPRLRQGLLSFTGLFLTIPSFALFAIFVPIFGFGYVPILVALTFYGIFPIFRNTVTGIESVDASVVDAARGMGMSRARRLLNIQLPLAWPVILNGVRVASIMLVAIAAIGAAVNGPGLGELIFTGLERLGGAGAIEAVLVGTLGVVLVALVLDLIFLFIRWITTPKGLRV